MAEPFDVAEMSAERLAIYFSLCDGDGWPLADYLEGGGELHHDQRAALIKLLRGEFMAGRGKGRPRTQSQRWLEASARMEITELQRHFAWRYGSGGSFAKALDAYHKLHPGRPPATVRNYLRREGGGLTEGQLQWIDECRARLKGDVQ